MALLATRRLPSLARALSSTAAGAPGVTSGGVPVTVFNEGGDSRVVARL